MYIAITVSNVELVVLSSRIPSMSAANDHHACEALFKALARALRMAVTPDPRRSGVASTKGSLELDGGGA